MVGVRGNTITRIQLEVNRPRVSFFEYFRVWCLREVIKGRDFWHECE